MQIAISFIGVLSESRPPTEALHRNERGPRATGDTDHRSRASTRPRDRLVGLEAGADGHRQHRQRADGVHDLSKHGVLSVLPDRRCRDYFGLKRAPAASANVASAAAVYSRCFHPDNFARIEHLLISRMAESVAATRAAGIGRPDRRSIGRYPERGRTFGSMKSRHRHDEALGIAPVGPTDPRASTCASCGLVGLEARTHGHRQHRQRSEGVHDLLEHEDLLPFRLMTERADLVRLEPGTGRERQRGQRRCGVQQVLQP